MPLVIDTTHAARSRPDLPLPQRYAFADDAARQIADGRASHARCFGAPPVGMWPPEGSVSPEAVVLYERAGVRWLATDEGNLWRSRSMSNLGHERGELYRPHHHAGVDLVFRDRELSDRIGFAYMHGDAAAGAEDLVQRAAAAAQVSAAPGGDPALVGVFLDGENPWESYVGSGEPFLRALFERLSNKPDIVAVTVSEHLAATQSRGALPALHSGSWIDSDFHIWIGDPVKNRAWELLLAAHKRIEDHRAKQGQPGVDSARVEAAVDEAIRRILPAEGSDWFWWFGAPFSSAEDHIFDRLFRTHLDAVYRALGEPSPPALSFPVDDRVASTAAPASFAAPAAMIRPPIGDEPGRRGYFAWAGAGYLDVSRGAAMAEQPLIQQIRFAVDRERLSIRLEPSAARADALVDVDVELALSHGSQRFRVTLGPKPPWHLDEAVGDAWIAQGEGAPASRDGGAAPSELGIPWARLAAGAKTSVQLVVRLLRGALVLARYPSEGAVELIVPDDDFEADHWSV